MTAAAGQLAKYARALEAHIKTLPGGE